MAGLPEPWNMRQWAESHESMDALRFRQVHSTLRLILAAMGMALTVLIAITGWSLKTNYDTQEAAITQAQETRAVVSQSSQQVVREVQQAKQAPGS